MILLNLYCTNTVASKMFVYFPKPPLRCLSNKESLVSPITHPPSPSYLFGLFSNFQVLGCDFLSTTLPNSYLSFFCHHKYIMQGSSHPFNYRAFQAQFSSTLSTLHSPHGSYFAFLRAGLKWYNLQQTDTLRTDTPHPPPCYVKIY